MSLKKYMIIDLIILFVVGTLTEFIAMYAIPQFIPKSAPFFVATLLVELVAIARWGYKGLVLIPFLSVVSFLSGKLVGQGSYPVGVLIADFVGLFGSSLALLFRKKGKKNSMFGEISSTIIQTLLIILVVILLITIVLIVSGQRVLDSLVYSIIQCLPGAFATIIFIIPLQRQSTLGDVKETLISKEEEKEMERKYYSQYANEVIEKNNQKKD